MRIFRFWVRHRATLRIADENTEVECWGGADESEAAAHADAEQRLAVVRARIGGQPVPGESYEADIREELVERLDAHNAITRNRYGALVLNSSDHLIIDIDEPRYRFWEVLFGLRDPRKRKQRILANLEKRAHAADCAGLGLRVYETHKGIRVIVTGRVFPPTAPESAQFMRSCNADWLYLTLCRKQACYRARLTPKPSRMRLRAHRVQYPRDAQQEAALRDWLPGYEATSARYATCRLLRVIGVEASSPVIAYHDRVCAVDSGRPLA